MANTVSGGPGSAIFGGAAGNGASNFSILNSTFYRNVASGDDAAQVVGGGYGDGGGGAETVFFSTFEQNNATNTGGGPILGGNFGSFGGAVLANSIVVGAMAGGECGGTFTDGGYNIADDASCGFSDTGSKNNTNPRLSPLGLFSNGGPTQTIALLRGSPAIDAIPVAACVDSTGAAVRVDQRGFPRPNILDGPTGPCDIGAFESQLP